MAQAFFAFSTTTYMVISTLLIGNRINMPDRKIDPAISRIVIISGAFIFLSYTFSGLLGGPSWINNERPDQIVQFLPLFLFIVFLLPFMITADKALKKIINGFSQFSLALFCTINLLCGFLIIRDHLQYNGDVLTEADVPLIDKTYVVDFIANNWKEFSDSNIIPVEYDLGGVKWDWVPSFGNRLTQWYPAPMTLGRSFDYELLRRYGLTNQQEGVQFRTFGNGRYLVTYAFKDAPSAKKFQITHFIFGRLRVSVVER